MAYTGFACRPEADPTAARDAAVKSDSATTESWFTDITAEVGLDFVHQSGGTGKLYLPEIMGGGLALFDYDNDGDLDLYLVNGHRGMARTAARSDSTNRLYRQNADDTFTDVTDESHLGDGGYGMGVAIGDIDNDGFTDVYVTNYGRDALYRNRGDGTFVNITAKANIEVDGWSCSATFLDYDRDGFLDLYVARYVEFNPLQVCYDSAGRHDYCGPKPFPPLHDILLRNNGDGTFEDVSNAAGVSSVSCAGLGVVAADLNDDGWIDLYVANDADPNQLWINQKDGTFRDDGMLMGAAYNINGKTEAGMGVLAADLDNDLDLDLFITHLGQETNTLYRYLGPQRGYCDVTGEAGLASSSLSYTGFGTVAFDVELDGDLDILVVNGRVVRGEPHPDTQVLPPWNIYAEPNLFFLNDGTGRFSSLGEPVANICQTIEISRGLALGDLDTDGDLDVVIANVEGRARIYRNDTPRRGHWLAVRAKDPRYRRDALGAKIVVTTELGRHMRIVQANYSYASASEPIAHFGIGQATRVLDVAVRWPDGLTESFGETAADRAILLTRDSGVARP